MLSPFKLTGPKMNLLAGIYKSFQEMWLNK